MPMKSKNSKYLILLSGLSIAICITSCINRKNNNIIEGLYSTTQNDINYFVELLEIDYETYSSSNGVNVVKDSTIKDTYFYIDFFTYENEMKKTFNFYNLVDHSANASSQPASYMDDNYNSFYPVRAQPDFAVGIYYNQIGYKFYQEDVN